MSVNASPTSSGPYPPGAARIGARYRAFHRTLSELWEGYELVRAIFPAAESSLRTKTLPPIEYRVLSQQRNIKLLSLGDALGVISRFQTRTMPAQTLTQATASFELLLADVARLIYIEFPEETLREPPGNDPKRDEKVVSIVLSSGDRAEIIDRLAEEKIRSSTYGSPSDFLTKDALRLRFRDHFKTAHDSLIRDYAEASARRNLWVHNDGRVDRKYLREVAGSGLRLGNVASVDETYLVNTFLSLRKLGACATTQALDGYYHVIPKGKLGSVYRSVHL